MNKKDRGYAAESIVVNEYMAQGWEIVARNFTIRGGEIDIVAENSDTRLFIEVKCVDGTEDLFDYISYTKLTALQRSIHAFMYQRPTSKNQRIEVVFVQQNHIVHVFDMLTL